MVWARCGVTPNANRLCTFIPSFWVWYLRSVCSKRPAATRSNWQIATCDDIRIRPPTMRCRPCVTLAVFAFSTPEMGARNAIHNGARPNATATSTDAVRVKRSTFWSGSSPLSICDQAASARVAEIANTHPSAAPLRTRSELSVSSWRKTSRLPAPMAIFKLNSRCRQVLCWSTPGTNARCVVPAALNACTTLSTEPLRSRSNPCAIPSFAPSPAIEKLSTPVTPSRSSPTPNWTLGITLKELNPLWLANRSSPPNLN